MVAFANTTRHNLLSFQFVHGIFILVLGIQILQELNRVNYKSIQQLKGVSMHYVGTIVTVTSLLEMKVMKTSSLTVVVATLGPGASNSELPNFFQF